MVLVFGPLLAATTPAERTWTDVTGRYTPGLGFDVALVPDATGDGLADVWVGGLAVSGALPFRAEGSALLLDGSALGPGTADLGDPTQVVLEVRLRDADGFSFGGAVAGGDITGDGLAELMIGTSGDAYGPDPMRVVVYPGGLTGTQTGPPDDQDILTILAGQADAASVYPGGTAIPAAPAVGDVDGDGCDDLVGGFAYDQQGRGTAQLLLGCRALSPVATPDAHVVGPHIDAGFGFDVAVIDRFDGDLGAEVAVGAPFRAGTEGSVYVLSSAGLSGSHDLATDASVVVLEAQGDPGAYLGTSVASAGDVDGDGFDDLTVSYLGLVASDRLYLVRGGAL